MSNVVIIIIIIIILLQCLWVMGLVVLLQVQSERQGFGGEEKGILVNQFRTSL